MSWEDFVAEVLAADPEEEEATEPLSVNGRTLLLETLEERHLSPFNLNTVTREELLTLDFLTSAQIDSLLDYRQKLRAFSSLGDLMLVRGLSHTDRRWLSLFVVVGDTLGAIPTWRRRLFEGRHVVDSRFDIPLYKRAGFIAKSSDEIAKYRHRYYLGPSMGNTLRHRYSWRRQIEYGATFQNDVGEPFAAHGNFPYDHVSGYFSYRPPDARTHILLGDFRAHFGLGLLQGNGFFFYPLQGLHSLPTHTTRLRQHTSTDEVGFLRGAAYSGHRGRWRWQAFVSHRRLDARLDGDTVRSFSSTGLHRSLTEIDRRNNVGLTSLGAHGEWRTSRAHLALNFLRLHYDRLVHPTPRLYNQHHFRGRRTFGVSFDHGVYRSNATWQGEAAIDRNGHYAVTQRLRLALHPQWTLLCQGRSFSPRYAAPSARTEQAGGVVQNEDGLSLSAAYRPGVGRELRGLLDVYRHRLPVFRADLPSSGMSGRLEYEWGAVSARHHRLHYSFRTRQRNITAHRGHLEYVTTHRLRYQNRHTSRRFVWQWALDGSAHHTQTRPRPMWGGMISSRFRFNFSPRARLSAFAALFSTHDHNTRLYAYTPRLRGTMAFSAFAHTGASVVVTAHASIGRRWEMGGRWSLLHLLDRRDIGTGMQRIASPTQNDLSFQLRHVF